MIIVAGTTYRTGTTITQRLINSSREKLIYGEDNYILETLLSYINFIEKNDKRSTAQRNLFLQQKDCFTANMLDDKRKYMYYAAKMFYSLYRQDGFKVLSPTLQHIDFAEWMTSTNGDKLKVVLCYRNVRDSWKSYEEIYNWISRDEFFNFFSRSNVLLRQSLNGKLPYVYPFKYESINEDEVNKLFDWLEIHNRSNIKSVLSNKLREMDCFDRTDKKYQYLEKHKITQAYTNPS